MFSGSANRNERVEGKITLKKLEVLPLATKNTARSPIQQHQTTSLPHSLAYLGLKRKIGFT